MVYDCTISKSEVLPDRNDGVGGRRRKAGAGAETYEPA